MESWVIIDDGNCTESNAEMVGGSIENAEYWQRLVNHIYYQLLLRYW